MLNNAIYRFISDMFRTESWNTKLNLYFLTLCKLYIKRDMTRRNTYAPRAIRLLLRVTFARNVKD